MDTFVFTLMVVLAIGFCCDIVELLFKDERYSGLQVFNVAFRSVLFVWSVCLVTGFIGA